MEVEVSREMDAAPEAVAAKMFDARNDAQWMGSVTGVDLPPRGWLAKGARVRRRGGFLGRKFEWVTEVQEYEPDRLLVLAFRDGPMTGEISYRIEPTDSGSRVTIHNRSGFNFTVLAWMLRQAFVDDLDRLAGLVERQRVEQ